MHSSKHIKEGTPPPGGGRPLRLTELFKIGLGPSSSHTVGPMKAAAAFISELGPEVARVHRLRATLYGSLAWTGRGHATDRAVILGLAGNLPDRIGSDEAEAVHRRVLDQQSLTLPDGRAIDFRPGRDAVFDFDEVKPQHPNAMAFEAFDGAGASIRREVWFSTGGGFVAREGDAVTAADASSTLLPFPFATMDELLAIGSARGLTIADIVFANETSDTPPDDVLASLDTIVAAMLACIESGLAATGVLPGGLGVARRAKRLFERLEARRRANERWPGDVMDHVSAFAIAVNEENAAGGRVVTAPTNGAAGVVPAVLRYYRDFCDGQDRDGMHRFLLAATAIGGTIKRNASISGAEVGCQGEVGSAAAMAAGGLAAALGASNAQVENAAEIALEHHLGMTCDPVAGLVQIPCIERNAFGALKAINAANLAMLGDGSHRVSLDQAIETMRQTGADMSEKYRETSRGGLAANVPAC